MNPTEKQHKMCPAIGAGKISNGLCAAVASGDAQVQKFPP